MYIYEKGGRLNVHVRVTVINVDKEGEREQVQQEAERLGLYAVRAYNNNTCKTRIKEGIRVETFHRREN
jgi:ssDNA-binding replication factor A large subunit